MRRALGGAAVLAASLWLAAAASAAGAHSPATLAQDVRLALSDAETELILGERAGAEQQLGAARAWLTELLAGTPRERDAALAALERAGNAVGAGDDVAFGAARATVWTTVLRAALAESVAAVRRGDLTAARAWVLVREFRPPTRFTRAATDATTALGGLEAGTMRPERAAAVVRADLLDTLEGRLRSSLDSVRDARRAGFAVRAAESAALAQGYWQALRPVFREQHGAPAARRLDAMFGRLVTRLVGQQPAGAELAAVERALEGFRAVPLGADEVLRRAGQLQRFVKLVAIEYGRGVQDGRVTKDFEIQEAITFRDGAASAFADIESLLLPRDAAATRRISAGLTTLGALLGSASRGDSVASADRVSAVADGVLDATGVVYPSAWKDAAKTADFDVITATLDRLEGAVASGDWGAAEQARLEAYGVFELGPEQRLRGLGPALFQTRRAVLLVRPRRARRARAPHQAAGAGRGDRRHPGRARRGAGGLRGADRQRAWVARLDRHQQRDHRFPRGPRGRPHPRRADGEPRRATAKAPAASPRRRGARPRCERRDLGRGADRARLAGRLGREALRGRRADRDRRAVADPQLVLPPRLLAGEPAGPTPAQEGDPRRREPRDPLGPGTRSRGARVLERLPRGIRDRPLPAGADPRGGRGHRAPGRCARVRGGRRGLPPRDRARASAAAQEDARRDGPDDHVGADRARRADGADPAEGRLGRRHARRGARAALLGGSLAGSVPDLAGASRAGGSARVRDRQLRRRRGRAQAEAGAKRGSAPVGRRSGIRRSRGCCGRRRPWPRCRRRSARSTRTSGRAGSGARRHRAPRARRRGR